RVTPEEPGLGADASLFDTAVGMEEPAAEEDEKPEIDQAGAGGVTPPVVAPPAVAPSS
ncbi:MAG: hypothetical protein GWN85_35185, partial [Gemmatimonadetes bacterium]|nr:hypothetical protein [Gemmatimonadota bacterium]NIW30703.1 hypothetical protein [Actinomycetota bacterium]NIX23111.1 hypothetical protein [Actinomycetota bacterium]